MAHCGIAARRACDQLIFDARVEINGKMVLEPGTQVNPQVDVVNVDGEIVKLVAETVVLLLHKPKDVVTTAKDEYNRETVLDIIDFPNRVVPVGRLDKNTTGALLLTNNGDLIYQLTHPKFEIEREYKAVVKPALGMEDIEQCRKGIALDDGDTAHFEVIKQSVKKGRATLRLRMYQGKNREIRRGFQALGKELFLLHRVHFAGFSADRLAEGKWRKLNKNEINKLWKLIK